MIKINKLNKFINALLLTIILLFSVNTFASNNEPLTNTELSSISEAIRNSVEETRKINSLEDLQQDLSNRFILGIFGKDALIYSLPETVDDSIIQEINDLSFKDLQYYSKPFNASNVNATLMILSSFFFVAFSVLALYFGWIMFESLFNTQDSGEVFGKKMHTMFSVLKTSFAMIMIVPAYGFSHEPFSDFENSVDGTSYGSFSAAQVFVFKATGYSNLFSNQIWGSFVNNYQKAYPTLSLPNTYSKENDMKQFLDYVMCVKSYNTKDTSNFIVKRADGRSDFKFNSSFKSCRIKGSVSFDAGLARELKKETEFAKMVSANVDYEAKFNDIVKESFTKIIEKSVIYADILMKENSSLTTSTVRNGLLVNATNWQSLCDTPEKMYVPDSLNKKTLPVLEYYFTKCMSEEFVLSYLNPEKEKARELYQSNILKNKQSAICSTETELEEGQRTFVKMSDLTTFENQSSKTLEACIAESCGSSNTGFYQCVSSIEFAKGNAENEKMIKQGWLTAGAYSYSLFSGFKNVSAKAMINSLNATFEYNQGRSLSRVSSENISSTGTTYSFPIASTNTEEKDLYSDFNSYMKLNNLTNNVEQEKKDSIALIEPAGGLANISGADGLFGIHKFVVCSTNPMSITEGFVCGNITEEMHDVGSKMFAFAIQLKLAKSLGEISGAAKSVNTNTAVLTGEKSGKGWSFIKSGIGLSDSAIKGLSKISGVAQLGGAAAGAGAGLYTLASNSDSFDSTSSYWFQNPETYLILVGTLTGTVGEFIEPYLSFLLNLLLILGIVFAFILPLLPYFLWITVISGWVVMILESLLIAPVWAATLITPSNDHSSKTAKKGLLILLTIVLRGPFMVVGLVISWILSNILIGSLLEISNINDALLIATNGATQITGFLDLSIKLIIYLSLIYFIYNLVFSIIEGFYEIGSSWLFGGSISPFANKDRSEVWKNNYQSTKSFLGVK